MIPRYQHIFTVIIEEHRNLNSGIASHRTGHPRAVFNVQVVHIIQGA